MKLLVLGASGGCGRWLCKLAVERGHQVRALIRPAARVDFPSEVEVVVGNVLDKATLESALKNRDGVLSALGIKRKSPMNPWSPIVSPSDLTTQVAASLVELMPKMEVQRVVAISAAGVGDSIHRVNPIIEWMIKHSNMALSYQDLEGMEGIFKVSSLAWMAVRPTTLTNGKPTGQVKEVDYYGLIHRISRGDVAHWMLDAMESSRPTVLGTPMISS